MKTLNCTLATIAITSLALAGCGSDPSTTQAGKTAEGSAAASQSFNLDSVQADENLEALLPDKFKADKVLHIATSADYPPAEYMDVDGQTPIGFDIDIIKAISKKLGLKPEVTHAPFESIIPAVGSKYDASISSFEINKERVNTVNMVSYMNSGSIFLVPKSNPGNVKTDSLCGINLGVQSGAAQQDNAEAASEKCVKENKPKINILPETDAQVLMTKLAGKQLDAAYVDAIVATLAEKNNPGKFETAGELVDSFPAGIVVGKNDTELAEAITKATQALIDDGTIAKIFETWKVDKSSVIEKSELNNPSM